MDATRRPAGWYPDPTDAARRRYWDGAHWAALTQPPTIVARPVERSDEPPPIGSPENPIGAGSVGLAAALASLTAAVLDGGPSPFAPGPQRTRRRRWGLRH